MRSLKLGARGDDVQAWQEFLKAKGVFGGNADGTFDQRTADATLEFQSKRGLDADGVAGNQTLGKAMQEGLDLAPDDPPIAGGPRDGVTSINDAWTPPTPPTVPGQILAPDPRVIPTATPGKGRPNNPPPPVGWGYWQGRVTPALTAFASQVEHTPGRFPMGSFVQDIVEGRLVAARVEWHDYQGLTGKTGVFRGTNLFRPKA